MRRLQTRLDCGCILQEHVGTGARISVRRCPSHSQCSKNPKTLNQRYYQGLGSINASGELTPGKYLEEFEEGMGELPRPALSGAKAIEIGGGISPYASMLLDRGYHYTLVEPSPVACEIMQSKFPTITTHSCLFPQELPPTVVSGLYDVVLSAHSLEHMRHAINALWYMGQLLTPTGKLYLLIPNDEDLTNPDHFWFFNEESIRKAAELCHLSLQRITVKQIVPIEKFMYCILTRK